MSIRTAPVVLLGKAQATQGTPESVSPAADAIGIANYQSTFNPQSIDINMHSDGLDLGETIVGGLQGGFTCEVPMRGNGVGVAPEGGLFLRLAALEEVISASAVGPEALAAGASQIEATLGASASVVAQFYRGMPVDFTNVVAGRGYVNDYSAAKLAKLTHDMGATLEATTDYEIPANVLYRPFSGSVPFGTFEIYEDGWKTTMIDARAEIGLTLVTAAILTMRVTVSGLLIANAKVDAALPSPTLNQTQFPVFRSGSALIERLAAGIAELSLNMGNQVVYPPDPNEVEGFASPEIMSRRITGSINPNATLLATRDIFNEFRSGTERIVHASYGDTAGNRIGITIPRAKRTTYSNPDRQGQKVEQTDFEARGANAGFFLCFD